MSTLQPYSPSNIPHTPGIYSFSFKQITPQTLGLRGLTSFTTEEILRAKAKLASTISRVSGVVNHRVLKGTITEPGKRKKNRLEVSLFGQTNAELDEQGLLAKIEVIEDFQSLISVLSAMSMVIPPLYVGITIDQSLSQRFAQHQNDYIARKGDNFGFRLYKSGIDWDQVQFSAISLPNEVVRADLLELVEGVLHTLTKPVLSSG